jgi:hypothetical protein
MKKVTKSSEIGTVLGQTQKTPIKFSYEFEAFESVNEIREAGEWPNEKEVLDYANAKRERSALSSARNTAMEDVASKIRETREYKVSQFVAAAVAAGMTREAAQAIAESQIPQ